jgi:hypothetical protein
MRYQRLFISITLALLMLGPTILSYSPNAAVQATGSTDNPDIQWFSGEGPSPEYRSNEGLKTFLDIIPMEVSVGISTTGEMDFSCTLKERNNVDLTISSCNWKILTLQGDYLTGGSVDVGRHIKLPALGSLDWSLTIDTLSTTYWDMMFQGRDRLKLVITFRGTDANANVIEVSKTVQVHLTHRVAMLVDEDIYPLIKENLKRYEEDVNIRSSVEFLYRAGSWTTPESIRSLLTDLWMDEGITGAILWGYLPYAKWQFIHSDDSKERFPIPVFYEDLDGQFIDSDSDGYYDKHIWGENDGTEIWVSHIMPPKTVVPSTHLDPNGQGTGGGLLGKYYKSDRLTNLALTRVDPTIDFYWTAQCPQELQYTDDYSIAWTGRIKADVTDTYTLSILHGGGAKVWIDGTLVWDNPLQITWNNTEFLVDIELTRGWHNIQVHYYENGWGLGYTGAIRLLWTSTEILGQRINDYLDRSHAYHNGELEYPKRGLFFMDYAYGVACDMDRRIRAKHIDPLYGNNYLAAGSTNATGADDYIELLDKGGELVSVWSHAGSNYHHINAPDLPDGANTSATSWMVRGTEAGLVTLIWGCHAGDYGDKGPGTSKLTDNLAANYAFSTPHGLASAGATRSMGTTFANVYHAWQNGSSMATGFFAYLDFGYDKEKRMRQWVQGGEYRWVEDVVLFGDPFIRIDHRPSESDVTIDDGAQFTNDRDVVLSISSVGAKEMRLKNAGGSWSPWEAFSSTKEWTLSGGNGYKRVMMLTRNSFGTSFFSVSDTITYVENYVDEVFLTIDGGALYTSNPDVLLGIDVGETDSSGLIMRIKDDGTDWSSWQPFASSTEWTIYRDDGERTISVMISTPDGLWTTDTSASIIMDTHPPVTKAIVTGEKGIAGWYRSAVTVDLGATDGHAGVGVTEFTIDDGTWQEYTDSITIDHDGYHLLKYRSRDNAGNTEKEREVPINIDTIAPAGLSMIPSEGRYHINIATIGLIVTAIDEGSGIDSMRFSLDGISWDRWMTFDSEYHLTLPNIQGEIAIYLSVRDVAGNEVQEPIRVRIIRDSIAPDVIEVVPDIDAKDVPVTSVISISFDENIDTDSINGQTLMVQDSTGNLVEGNIEYDADSYTVRFVPNNQLIEDMTYNVVVYGGLTDLARNGLRSGDGILWSFTTVGLEPGSPGGIVLSENEGIEIQWLPPEDMGTGHLLGYRIYRMAEDGSTSPSFIIIAATENPYFIDSAVVEEVMYHYMVSAYNSVGEGELSPVVSMMLLPELPVDDPVDDVPEPKQDQQSPDVAIDDAGPEAGTGTIWFAITIIVVIVAGVVGVVSSLSRKS